MDEVERIARGLSSQGFTALMRFCEIGNDPYGRQWEEFASSRQVALTLEGKGLLISGHIYGSRTRTFRYTEAGLAVREFLLRTPDA